MSFSNPITGGQGALIRPAVKSPNFVTGVSGWTIRRDGSAEFNNVVIRNSIQAGGAILLYNGTPAAGNLAISLAQSAGVDSFGNSYPAGFQAGDHNGTGFFTLITLLGDIILDSDHWNNGGGLSLNDSGISLFSPSNTSGTQDDPVSFALFPGDNDGTPASSARLATLSGKPVEFDFIGEFRTYSSWTPFTPVWANVGTATFTTNTGYWRRLGEKIDFDMYATVSNPGSGAGIVGFDVAWSIDRTIQQIVAGHIGGSAAINGTVCALALPGGSGPTVDRIRTSVGANITGAQLTAGTNINIQGFFREG